MAMTGSEQADLGPASEEAPKSGAEPLDSRRAPPVWVVPVYLAGLLFVYVGERLLPTLEKGHVVVTVLGLLAAVGATGVRFSPRFRAGGDRQQIENLQAAFSLIGLGGLIVYFASSDWGLDHIGYAAASVDKRASVTAFLTVVWVAAIAIAVLPMIFAETALLPMRTAERPESRRVRAAAGNGLVLALAATYAALFVYFGAGLELKADYSYFKTSKPSESTRKIAQSFRDPVKVVAFFPDVNEVRSEVRGYFAALAKGTPNFKIEFKDRLLVPKEAQDLHVTGDGVIVLSKGTNSERMQISTKIDEARPKLKTLDREVQEKLLKLVRSRRTAYMTVGHGELNDPPHGRQAEEGRSGNDVRQVLEKLNYQPKDLGLGQGLGNEIPDDAGIVLILGPSQPFAPEEIGSLKRYVDRGGHIFMALDPDTIYPDAEASPLSNEEMAAARERSQQAEAAVQAGDKVGDKKPSKPKPSEAAKAPAAPSSASPAADQAPAPASGARSDAVLASLSELANLVGLKYSGDILANDKRFVPRRFNDSDHVILFSTSFSSHASVSTLSRNAPQAAVIVSGAGSLDRADGSKDKIDFTVRSMPGTFADVNHDYRQEAPAEQTGTFNMAAAVTRPIGTAKKADKPKDPKNKDAASTPEPDEMRAFVVADADVFSDLILPKLANVYFFADAIRWLGGEESFAGAPESEEDVRIEHTRQQDLLWFYATIFGAPAIVLGVGLTAAQRSRRSRGGKR